MAGPDTLFFQEDMSSGERFQKLLADFPGPEPFVRRALQQFESDFREMALLALADWTRLDVVSAEMFQTVASLQRPSWGSWNGLLTGLTKARRSVLHNAGDDLRDRIESSEVLSSVLQQLELRVDSDLVKEFKPLCELTRTQLPKKTRLRAVLTMPIALRNRIAHDAPSDADWWQDTAEAMKPLVEFHAHLSPLTLLLADMTEYPEPWFLLDDDGTRLVFNGLANDQSIIYVTPSGKSSYEPDMTRPTMLAFQSLLGKADQQEDDFRKLLSKLAPEEIRGVMMGKYLVGRPVGQGGFATVHVGRQLNTGRKVAIKILHDGQGDKSKDRFQQEAQFLSRIDHPNVVKVFGYGEETWSAPRAFSLSDEKWFESFSKSAPVKCYIAMEWVEGKTLDDYADLAENERPGIARLGDWFAQSASALAAVHSSGLVHRDIKPSNLMVTEDDEVKLMDFGIARSQSKERTLQTATGNALGTPAYMSPEQIRAADREAEVGPPTDVYSLCATFYELIAARRLYDHDTATMEMVTTQKLSGVKPEKPSVHTNGLPWELETILLGGLEPDVEDRYRTMEALKLDIDHYLRDEPIEYKRPNLMRRLQLGYRRNRLVANLCTGFLVLALMGAISYVRDIQDALQAEREAHERRVKAEINLLRTGDENAARVALNNLRQFAEEGDDIDGLLDAQLEDGGLPEEEELRLHMAMIDADVEKHAGPLLVALQSASPAEAMLAREVMLRQANRLVEPMWDVLLNEKEPADERLRAACCLAAWAKDDSRWAKIGNAVADRLIRENRLEMAEWIKAFRDVAPNLVSRLSELFRDSRLGPAERLTAAMLLSSFASDDTEMLARLIVDANREQFAELFRVLRRRKDVAVPLLQKVLNQSVDENESGGPLLPEWSNPSPSLIESIQSARGLVSDRFAFAISLQIDQFESVNSELARCGFRPLQFRRHGHTAAVLWIRDGATAVVETFRSGEELQQRVESARAENLSVIDASRFLSPGEDESVLQFAAVFSASRPGARPTLLSIDDPEDDAATWVVDGYQPLTWQASAGPTGKQITSVWYRPASLYPTWDIQQGRPFEIMGSEFELTGSPAHDISVWSGEDGLDAEALWVLRRDATGRTQIGPVDESLTAQCHELEEAGWRVVGVSAGSDSDGQTVAAIAWHKPLITDEERAALAKQQATAAVALLRLSLTGNAVSDSALAESTWELLSHSEDTGIRSELIHSFQPLGVPSRVLADRLAEERDTGIRRALILSLGEYPPRTIAQQQFADWKQLLVSAWQNDPDPGIHSAAEWTLNQWGTSPTSVPTEVDSLKARGQGRIRQLQKLRSAEISRSLNKDATPDGWFVNSEGHTLVIVPRPVQFTMGADVTAPNWNTKSDMQHERIVPRGFAIATTEVRLDQYLRFTKQTGLMEFTKRDGGTGKLEFGSTSGEGVRMDAPVAGINLLAAATYCNWLSQQEELPESEWCYHIIEEDGVPLSVELNPDYLRRTGYRLPTEAEWEYASRANADSTRFFGYSRELLDEYAWFGTKTWGVRRTVQTLKPNDFGLFDMLGNAEELCEFVDRGKSDPGTPDCFIGRPGPVSNDAIWSARGSQYNYVGSKARDSYMRTVTADRRSNGQSFRVARTWQTRRDQVDGLTDLMDASPGTAPLYLERALAAAAIRDYEQAESDYQSYVQSAADYTGGLWLTGRGEHVVAPHIAFDEMKAFTIEAIVRDWSQSIVYQGQPAVSDDDSERALFLTSDRAGWVSDEGFSGSSISEVWDQGSNHIALVYDGQGVLTFVNGELVEKTAAGELVVNSKEPLLVGSEGGSLFGAGLITGLRISNTARYAEMSESDSENSTTDQPPLDTLEADDSTILFYDFTNIDGRLVEDRSGNEQHGQLVDAWWLEPGERTTSVVEDAE